MEKMTESSSLDENFNSNDLIDQEQLLKDIQSGAVDVHSKETQDLLNRLFPEICPINSWAFEDKLRTVTNIVYQVNRIICATGSFFYIYAERTEDMWATCDHSGFNSYEGLKLKEALMKELDKEKEGLKQYEQLVEELKRNLTLVNGNWWIKATFPSVLEQGVPVNCIYYVKTSRRICYETLKVNLPMQNKRLYPLLCLVQQVYSFATVICMDQLKIAFSHPGIQAIKNKEKAIYQHGTSDPCFNENAQGDGRDVQQETTEVGVDVKTAITKDDEENNVPKKKVFINKTSQLKREKRASEENKTKSNPNSTPGSTSTSRACSKSPSVSRSRPGSRPSSIPSSRPGSRPSSIPSSRPGSRPSSVPRTSGPTSSSVGPPSSSVRPTTRSKPAQPKPK